MKEIKAKPFKNKITITGEIYKMDEYINYIPYPLVGFDIRSHRPSKGTPIDVNPTESSKANELPLTLENENDSADTTNNQNFDEIRIIRFHDETLLDDYQIGDRVRIKGELQSRNYATLHPLTDDLIQNAVELYTNFFEEGALPCEKQPTSRIKQPILWEKLFQYNLIDEIPADSLIREDGLKEKTETQIYTYKVDENGEVTKETENTAFEVIAHTVEKLNEPLDLEQGDENHVVYHGRVSRSPVFDIIDTTPFSKLTVQSFVNYFQPEEKRFVFFNFFVWGKNAEIILNDLEIGDMVRFTGRLQSKVIERTLRLKKKNAAGKTKRKKITINESVREVSIEKMAKISQKASS